VIGPTTYQYPFNIWMPFLRVDIVQINMMLRTIRCRRRARRRRFGS
jgi:hypothetical protein